LFKFLLVVVGVFGPFLRQRLQRVGEFVPGRGYVRQDLGVVDFPGHAHAHFQNHAQVERDIVPDPYD
jgi:hypothetical protein